jgi:adenylate cyclase
MQRVEYRLETCHLFRLFGGFGYMSKEIERKYVLAHYPDREIREGTVRVLSKTTIDQTYLALAADQEIRVRKIVHHVPAQGQDKDRLAETTGGENTADEGVCSAGQWDSSSDQEGSSPGSTLDSTQSEHIRYTHTFKQGKGMAREEVEYDIHPDIYGQLIRLAGSNPLQKIRSKVEYDGIQIEIDEYVHVDLIVAEVEFESEEEARAFQPPYWFGREVGPEEEYSNKTLWKQMQ